MKGQEFQNEDLLTARPMRHISGSKCETVTFMVDTMVRHAQSFVQLL